MKIMFSWLLLVGLVFASIIGNAFTYLQISHNPVRLNLSPFIKSNSTALPSHYDIKTSPRFFEQVMDLTPGRNFTFNFDKWIQIQRSGLFSNLTVRTVTDEDGSIALDISGHEFPSLRFAPEITISRFSKDPEVSGGVSVYIMYFYPSTFEVYVYL